MGNRLSGPLADVSGDAGYREHPPRVGFFTDTSVCIGCKACEVACKEWNGLPDTHTDVLSLTGMSYDNTEASAPTPGGTWPSSSRPSRFRPARRAATGTAPPGRPPGG